MCGIIGKAGVGDVFPTLLNGLKNLEYRGYDSAGVAGISGGKICCYKVQGRVEGLAEKVEELKPHSTVGIGHTRWATHGEPTTANAHPHISEDGTFALVHNGIIENAEEIKATLLPRDIRLSSQTDTEIAVQLIGRLYKGNVVEAISQACRELVGSFAFGILCEHTPQVIYAVGKNSPLMVARCKDGCAIVSDLCAIAEAPDEVYRLCDGEICAITSSGISFFNPSGELIEKYPEKTDYECAFADMGGYRHFMLKEIYEQPKAVENTVNTFLENGEIVFPDVKLEADFFKNRLNKIIIAACGSAYHAGLCAKGTIEAITGVQCQVEIASEFRYSQCFADANTLAIFISQSGETADTLAALRLAKKYGARVISVVNVKGSAIAEESEGVIYTRAGREVAVATTKAYSAQLVALYALALFIGKAKGVQKDEKHQKYVDELLALPEKIQKTLASTDPKMKALSQRLYREQDLFFIGRLSDYATAAEGALKIKEISYINAQSYPAGEMKHGTISLIDKGTPVIAVAGKGRCFNKTISNISEIRARGGRVVLITDEGEKDSAFMVDEVVFVPEVVKELQGSLLVLPLQLLSYYTADLRGCDIDKPKNLAKSVTVE